MIFYWLQRHRIRELQSSRYCLLSPAEEAVPLGRDAHLHANRWHEGDAAERGAGPVEQGVVAVVLVEYREGRHEVHVAVAQLQVGESAKGGEVAALGGQGRQPLARVVVEPAGREVVADPAVCVGEAIGESPNF